MKTKQKIQWNWGNGLVVIFSLFAVFILTLAYKTMFVKSDLVSKDYYAEELRYQHKIDGVANANKLNSVQMVQDAAGQFLITLPILPDEGEIWFYCSNDAAKDQKIALRVNAGGQQIIPPHQLAPANYQVKIKWQSGGEWYYSEKAVTIQ